MAPPVIYWWVRPWEWKEQASLVERKKELENGGSANLWPVDQVIWCPQNKAPIGKGLPSAPSSDCSYRGACVSLCGWLSWSSGRIPRLGCLSFALHYPPFTSFCSCRSQLPLASVSADFTSPNSGQAMVHEPGALGSHCFLSSWFYLASLIGTGYLSLTSNSNTCHFCWSQLCLS